MSYRSAFATSFYDTPNTPLPPLKGGIIRWTPHPVNSGFSLMEIMIVMLLLGIMAMAGFPALNSALQKARLTEAMDEIYTALSVARIKSMNTGQQTRVTIDSSTETARIEVFQTTADLTGGGTELAEADVEGGSFINMKFPMNPGDDYFIDFSDQSRFSDIDIVSADFGGNNHIIFSDSGAPSNGGQVIVSCGSFQANALVEAITGKITRTD